MTKSPGGSGYTVPQEALYRWTYVLPKDELATSGILVQSTRTKGQAPDWSADCSGKMTELSAVDPLSQRSGITPTVPDHDQPTEGPKAHGLADGLISRVREMLARGSIQNNSAKHPDRFTATADPKIHARPEPESISHAKKSTNSQPPNSRWYVSAQKFRGSCHTPS